MSMMTVDTIYNELIVRIDQRTYLSVGDGWGIDTLFEFKGNGWMKVCHPQFPESIFNMSRREYIDEDDIYLLCRDVYLYIESIERDREFLERVGFKTTHSVVYYAFATRNAEDLSDISGFELSLLNGGSLIYFPIELDFKGVVDSKIRYFNEDGHLCSAWDYHDGAIESIRRFVTFDRDDGDTQFYRMNEYQHCIVTEWMPKSVLDAVIKEG